MCWLRELLALECLKVCCNGLSQDMISETVSNIQFCFPQSRLPSLFGSPRQQQEGSQQLRPNILTALQPKKESFSFLTISNRNANRTTWGDGPLGWVSPAHVLTPRSQTDAN